MNEDEIEQSLKMLEDIILQECRQVMSTERKVPFETPLPEWFTRKLEAAASKALSSGNFVSIYNVGTEYVITRESKKDLRWVGNKWKLKEVRTFRSIRLAKVFIKRNIGMFAVGIAAQLSGAINQINVTGVITNEHPR